MQLNESAVDALGVNSGCRPGPSVTLWNEPQTVRAMLSRPPGFSADDAAHPAVLHKRDPVDFGFGERPVERESMTVGRASRPMARCDQ